ncbi:MAG: pyrroline-5-carboxylate reductase [Verrucomicrobiota bacterium]
MKIGFLGCGKMASALVGGVVKAGACPAADILVSDCVPSAMESLAAKSGVTPVADNRALALASEALVLCVKPADALETLRKLDGALAGKLLISIVAGLSLDQLQQAAGPATRVVRVMPNTPAMIHQGAAAFATGSTATEADATLVTQIFSSVGRVAQVKELLLDAVTGLSGSGPAYVYLMIEALADGGVLMGLPRDLALQLAAQTVAGAAGMVLQTGLHPAVLKDQVTSPGGTTIAGLEQMEAGAVRSALISAVRAAAERSRELGA